METQKIDRNSETTISELPDPVMYHILFYLPAEDAARTTVLSKDWLRIWHSLPVCNFVFDQSLFENKLISKYRFHKLEKEEKVQKFIDFVNESLSILLRQKVRVQSFTLILKYRDSTSFRNTIIYWLVLITNNSIKKLTLNEYATRQLDHYVLSKKKFNRSKLSRRLKCLRELSLTYENLEGNGIGKGLDHIVSCCSSLEALTLAGNARGWWRYSVSLSKLCAKNIRVEHISELNLSHATLDRVQISSPDLQTLNFSHIDSAQHFGINVDTSKTSNDEVVIHIDAPNLRQLYYSGDILVSLTSDALNFSHVEHCCLTISPRHDLNTSWFFQLRKFLEKFSYVNLTINIDNDVLFQRHETMHYQPEGSRRFLPPPDIGPLRINCHKRLSNYKDLIDGLLWCCRPHSISAYASDRGNPFLKFFIGELAKIMTEETPSCCTDRRGYKCWRHYARFSDISIEWSNRLLDAMILHWGS